MKSFSFDRFAAICALLVGPGSLLYAALFISIVEGASGTENDLWFAVLMLGALFTMPVMIAVYQRIRATDAGLALTAFLFGLGGALGGVLHGGYELAARITPPEQGYFPGPEAVTKGILRYAVAGLALLLIGWLIVRGGRLPKPLGLLAVFGGVVLVVIYIGRLFDFITPGDYASLIPPILFGFVLNPLWYGWVGLVLWRSGAEPASAETPQPATR